MRERDPRGAGGVDMTETIRLRPCPFCGGAGELAVERRQRDGHMIDYVTVRCSNCKAQVRKTECDTTETDHYDAEQKEARLWNRRTRE